MKWLLILLWDTYVMVCSYQVSHNSSNDLCLSIWDMGIRGRASTSVALFSRHFQHGNFWPIQLPPRCHWHPRFLTRLLQFSFSDTTLKWSTSPVLVTPIDPKKRIRAFFSVCPKFEFLNRPKNSWAALGPSSQLRYICWRSSPFGVGGQIVSTSGGSVVEIVLASSRETIVDSSRSRTKISAWTGFIQMILF